MSHGSVMIDLADIAINQEEKTLLQHPATGGVILFSRNYSSPEQMYELIQEIHAIRSPSLLVAVDQEGGRVQRFRDGLTRLPPAAWFGQLYDANPVHAQEITREVAWLLATEMRSLGVDFSFSPVLDLGKGVSQVIGDRAFHHHPNVVSRLAHAWIAGLHEAGMVAVGKHFPGHGSVDADSHLELPVDHRCFADLEMEDMIPFQSAIDQGLEGIMPAHLLYDQIDRDLAGFSDFWLQRVLREKMGFQGVIFSDDLTMNAAEEAGNYAARAQSALTAGCDMVLVCNNPKGAVEVLECLTEYSNPAAQMRLLRMHGRDVAARSQYHLDPRWKRAVEMIGEYDKTQAMDLLL
ncbi:MAG: beta-N-acetylhexosaminidase [Gammaproteobacteria bacterium]|nr:beta-N-acetylhexosaminidase [Gammaproteobacteria bacterium]